MTDLHGVLSGLGSSESEVAKRLDWAGATGRRQSRSGCPIANFVRLYYPDAFDIDVTGGTVCVWEERADLPYLTFTTAVPQPVSEFLVAFDAGRFPRLDETQVSREEVLEFESVESREFVEWAQPPRIPL